MEGSGWPATSESPGTPSVEVSGWGRRLGAFLIDYFLLLIPMVMILMFRIMPELVDAGLLEVSGPFNEEDFERVIQGMEPELVGFGLLYILTTMLYFIVMHGALGRTLGKMAVGIKVIKDDGSPCDYGAAVKRAVVYPLGGIIPTVGWVVVLINGLWPLWDEKSQSLGDKLGKTYVVRRDAV